MAGQVMARGLVDSVTTMKVFRDGTFTVKTGFGKESAPDRLVGFEHDADSMRRKSVTGRGAAALFTGGVSLLASNNRGVLYVTVTGERTGVRTFTTRNPSGTALSSVRALKAAADSLVQQPTARATADIPAQLRQLAELHSAGALSDSEFAAAKSRLLG